MWGICVIIQSQHQSHILKELHQDHPGSSWMKSEACSMCGGQAWIKTLKTLQSCVSCQQNKPSPSPAPMHPWSWSVKPWQ